MKPDAFLRRMAASGILSVLCGLSAQADEPVAKTPPANPRPTRIELRDKQYDVSLDARDIERILARLKRASELSKQRITEAAESAESVAGAIDRDPAVARDQAQETSKKFEEIAKLLEALLTEETPQKIAAARNIAAQLAKAEQQLAQQAQATATMMQSPEATVATGTPDPKLPPKPKGQGGGKRSEEETDKPKEGANGKTISPESPAANANSQDELMPNGSGSQPKENANKDPSGKEGGSSEKKNEEQGGSGPSKDEKADATGSGGDAKKPDDPATEPKTAGSRTVDGKNELADEKSVGGGGRRVEKRPLTNEERVEQLAGRAGDLAARAATLLDILESIATSELPEDRTAAEKVGALLKETDLKKTVESMQAAADQLRNQKLEDARVSAMDVADRFQITTQRLDAVYRAMVGPQAEELRKLEQQLLQLRDKLEGLETPAQVIAWHRAANELLEQAEDHGLSEKRREELLEEMKKNGITLGGAPTLSRIQLTDGRYVAPQQYSAILIEVQEELQSRIQSLVLGDFASMTDDLAPPKYQSLVERYNQVLTREKKSAPGNMSAKPKTKP